MTAQPTEGWGDDAIAAGSMRPGVRQVLNGKRVLFVASTGGHLAQLKRIADAVPHDPASEWVTFRTPQSESLLVGQRRHFIDYVRPRDVVGVLRSAWFFNRLLARRNFDVVVSTGAAVALSSHLVAVLRRQRAMYIESVSRFQGPSLTGRLLAGTRLVAMYTQHRSWAGKRWQFGLSVLDTYRAAKVTTRPVRRIFVTLGTIKPYRFDALIDSVLAALPDDVEITWQIGVTSREDLPGRVFSQLPAEEFEREVREADVVVTHAGVGTLMQLLDLGACVVVAPRRHARAEHVDDHQEQVASALGDRDLVVVREAPDLTWHDLAEATRIRVVQDSPGEAASA